MVRATAYSPDKRWIALGGVDPDIILIDRTTGKQHRLSGHRDWINALAFTSDSKQDWSQRAAQTTPATGGCWSGT